MVTRQFAPEHQEGKSLTAGTLSYAQTGRGQTAVRTPQENMCMNVLAVGQQSTGQTPVQPLSPEIRTPLIADEWETALTNTRLINRYPRIPHFIRHGLDTGIPPTFLPSPHLITPPSLLISTSFMTLSIWSLRKDVTGALSQKLSSNV